MMKIKEPPALPRGQELVGIEQIKTVDGKFTILKYTIRVTVDGTPFLAEVNFGSCRNHVWHPEDVWVQAAPDEKDEKVCDRVRREAARASSRGFQEGGLDGFVPLCDKCRGRSVAAKFKEALLLPRSADIDVSATITLATRWGETRQVGEEVAATEYESYDLCMLHGPHVRHDEEPFD